MAIGVGDDGPVPDGDAAARVVIVEMTSASTALTVSKIMPYAVAAVLVAWMIVYGQRAKRKGERLAAASRAEAALAQPEPTA